MGTKALNSANLEELRVWLASVKFDATRLNRECSDGVRIAKLIQQIWPNTIELDNYPSQNSTARKISNWQVLNRKVLKKLGIEQKQATVEKLAKGTEGAVEELLCAIMNIKKSRDRENEQANTKPEEQNEVADGDPIMMDPVMMDPVMVDPVMMDPEMVDPVMMVPVKQTIGDVVVEVPQKMINYSAYLSKVAECEKIESALQANMDKIEELKKLVEIGNKRIMKLSAQLNLKDNETVEEEELIHFSD